jgi:hypothetical protein
MYEPKVVLLTAESCSLSARGDVLGLLACAPNEKGEEDGAAQFAQTKAKSQDMARQAASTQVHVLNRIRDNSWQYITMA